MSFWFQERGVDTEKNVGFRGTRGTGVNIYTFSNNNWLWSEKKFYILHIYLCVIAPILSQVLFFSIVPFFY